MKLKWYLLLVPLVLSSCLMVSLHPFYQNSEVLANDTFEGTFLDQDSSTWVIRSMPINRDKSGDTIAVYMAEINPLNGKKCSFIVHLFKVERQWFADFFPNDGIEGNELIHYHLVSMHTLAKLSIEKNRIEVRWYNESWLGSLLKKEKNAIKYEQTDSRDDNGVQYIITATSEDLQPFLKKYASHPLKYSGELKKDEIYTNANLQRCVSQK